MTKPHRVLAVCLVLLLAACGGSETPTPQPNPTPSPAPAPTPNPTTGANNSAVLTGPALGSGTTSNSSLQKALSVGLTGGDGTFRLGQAYATRTSADTETVYWVVLVTNQSRGLQCLVAAEGLTFQDAAGQALVTNDVTYLSGSVGQSSGIYTDTCLGGGETGYFFGTELGSDVPAVYSSVTNITISALSSFADFETVSARVLPQSYAVSGKGVAVTVRNDSPGTVRLGGFSHYFLLDESDRPLGWGFFSGDEEDVPVAAEGTQILTDTLFYDGQASRMRVRTDFRGLDAAASARQTPQPSRAASAEALLEQYVTSRNEQGRTRQMALERTRSR